MKIEATAVGTFIAMTILLLRSGLAQLHFDLYLPASKRFRKTVELFGPIDPATSSFKYFGTKVELTLKKSDTRSWAILEKTDRSLGPVSLTFGVGGRTGTIGAKEVVLDDVNASKIQA